MSKNKIEDVIPSNAFNGIYRGVVEDNNDPLKHGRCRVRIFGIHTSEKNPDPNTGEGIATDQLIWAEPAGPLTGSGGNTGFGLFCTPLPGTQVFLFFECGNFLQPRYFAVSNAKIKDVTTTISKNARETAEKSAELATEAILTNWDGSSSTLPSNCDNESLGAVSRYYETGCKGPATVSTGNGDYGGVSYGLYQLTSRKNKDGSSNIEKFYQNKMDANDRKYFEHINPRDWSNPNGQCVQAWKKWATENEKHASDLMNKQAYEDYYLPAANYFIKAAGFDPNGHRALQEMILSTSIQHGPGGAKNIFNFACKPGMTDVEIIEAVYKRRGTVEITFKSSPKLWDSLRKRLLTDEPKMVMAFLDDEQKEEAIKDKEEAVEKLTPDVEATVEQEVKDVKEQQETNPTPPQEGFTDKTGKFPKQVRAEDPPIHRLAAGNKEETAISFREEHLEKGNILPNGNSWDEPKPQYNSVYPHNTVFGTAGGATLELDSTPNAKAIRLTHPSNSYYEMGQDGSILSRANLNIYSIARVNQYMKVGADLNTSIANSRNTYIQNADNTQIIGSQDTKVLMNQSNYVGVSKSEIIGVSNSQKVLGQDDRMVRRTIHRKLYDNKRYFCCE